MAKRKYKTRVKEPATLKKSEPARELDSVLYWVTLLVLIIANFFASIVLIPLMFLASDVNFYLMLAVLALLFGNVFSILVTRIENLDVHHHIFAAFTIPALALLNLLVIANSTSRMASLLGLETGKNSVAVGALYLGFFLLPHLLRIAEKRMR